MFEQVQESNSAIDFHDKSGSRESPSHNQLRQLQYETIGDTLLICEAACHRVGIPWLPPTAEVQRRSAAFEAPLDEFIRLSLVTVSTKTLESYSYDLESSSFTKSEAESLYIPHPSLVERSALSALVFGILFAGDFLFCSFLGIPPIIAVVSSAIIGILGGVTCAALSTEQHRRKTFHWLLLRELLRRSGQDQINSNPVTILPVSTKPLSD